ncbi:hypothetical protein SAMN03159382_05909 [Pseudomonas sp. NFACC23-1]|nr:hypothetical protein SAMN03159386_05918 [Pseudomonas sp. NFACC17-2]SEJ98976.1 hypothetical protein SAMN03159382_05909 [Pseudomonas sp. NFACC23-1]SFW93090.1 hypothetical protein SAMN05660640_06013 [Pseudomonas sp. NFACC16-2]
MPNTKSVARGFNPAGARSGPHSNRLTHHRCQVLGLLRSPAGINPLATDKSFATKAVFGCYQPRPEFTQKFTDNDVDTDST